MRNITPGKANFTTSRTEIVHILISAAVLSLAMALIFRSGSITNYFEYHFGDSWAAVMFAVMFVLVLLSFVGHELGHKLVAQKYGLWSEYRMYPAGLLMSLVVSMFGFLIAAPGAVYIRGTYMTEDQNGKISMAGPMVNIVLAVIGFTGVMVFNHTSLLVPMYLLMTMNSSLALFNMLPVPPMDGSKIIGWNTMAWAGLIAVAGLLFVSRFLLPDLYWA